MDGAPNPETSGDPPQTDPVAALRRRAEEQLALTSKAQRGELTDADDMRLQHELEVHQVELEMQNEELRATQVRLELAVERLNHFYDFAPVGYLTLDDQGRIRQANLTLARMLQTDRRQLLNSGLATFVHRDDQTKYYLFRRHLMGSEDQSVCEVRLGLRTKSYFWARLEGGPWPEAAGISGWRVAVSDVSDRKSAEEALKELNQELERRVGERSQQLSETNRQLREEITRRREAELMLLDREEQLEQRVRDRTRDLESLLAISRDVVSTLQLDEVVGLILDHLQRTVGYTNCAIYVLEDGMVRVLDYRGELPRAEAQQIRLPLESMAGICEVVSSCSPAIIDDLASDSPTAIAWRERAQPGQLALLGHGRSWMAVPLLAKDHAIGVLRLDHEQLGYFDGPRAGMAAAIANHTAEALENARLYRQAQHVAAMEERQRMARELHDSVAQTFFGIVLVAETVRERWEGGGGVGPLLDRILALCKSGMAEMQAVISALRPEALRVDGLVGVLQREVTALRALDDIAITTHFPYEPDVPLAAKEAVYRIAQEALHNIVRHAGARHAALRLTTEEDSLLLEITDDGAGFDPSLEYPGRGLRSMRQRVAGLGGVLQIDSAPGHGTRVRAELPIGPEISRP